jgi:hypothetical protein
MGHKGWTVRIRKKDDEAATVVVMPVGIEM